MAVFVPEEFSKTQEHLDKINLWWLKDNTIPIRGVGFTASEQFFNKLKTRLFAQIFGVDVTLSQTISGNEPTNHPS